MKRLLTAVAAASALVIAGAVAFVYAQDDEPCAERFELIAVDRAEDVGKSLTKREAAEEALLLIGDSVADDEGFVEQVENTLGDDGRRVEYGNVIAWFEEMGDGSFRLSKYVICAEG